MKRFFLYFINLEHRCPYKNLFLNATFFKVECAFYKSETEWALKENVYMWIWRFHKYNVLHLLKKLIENCSYHFHKKFKSPNSCWRSYYMWIPNYFWLMGVDSSYHIWTELKWIELNVKKDIVYVIILHNIHKGR